jgi:hypothetical protein
MREWHASTDVMQPQEPSLLAFPASIQAVNCRSVCARYQHSSGMHVAERAEDMQRAKQRLFDAQNLHESTSRQAHAACVIQCHWDLMCCLLPSTWIARGTRHADCGLHFIGPVPVRMGYATHHHYGMCGEGELEFTVESNTA